jgi:hypothetical protein
LICRFLEEADHHMTKPLLVTYHGVRMSEIFGLKPACPDMNNGPVVEMKRVKGCPELAEGVGTMDDHRPTLGS